MKTLLSLLMALVVVLSMSQAAAVSDHKTIAVVPNENTPLREDAFRYETVALELPPAEDTPARTQVCGTSVEETVPPVIEPTTVPTPQVTEEEAPAETPDSYCQPPVLETEPEEEEEVISKEAPPIPCPPPCEPAPVAEEEEVPEDTISVEAPPIPCPPPQEP